MLQDFAEPRTWYLWQLNIQPCTSASEEQLYRAKRRQASGAQDARYVTRDYSLPMCQRWSWSNLVQEEYLFVQDEALLLYDLIADANWRNVMITSANETN